jgi:hypothetical protein
VKLIELGGRDLVIANSLHSFRYYGAAVQIEVQDTDVLAGGYWWRNPVVVVQSPYEDLFSQSQRIPYMG